MKTKWQVELVKTPTEKGRPYDIYHLHLHDETGEEADKQILVADLSRSGGGISMTKWKMHKHNGRILLAAFLEISVLGHDLDQWRYYDLETGEDVKDDTLPRH